MCCTNKRGEFLFISALEVRGLETFMYLYGLTYETEYPLFMLKRVAYGSNSTIWYVHLSYLTIDVSFNVKDSKVILVDGPVTERAKRLVFNF